MPAVGTLVLAGLSGWQGQLVSSPSSCNSPAHSNEAIDLVTMHRRMQRGSRLMAAAINLVQKVQPFIQLRAGLSGGVVTSPVSLLQLSDQSASNNW